MITLGVKNMNNNCNNWLSFIKISAAILLGITGKVGWWAIFLIILVTVKLKEK